MMTLTEGQLVAWSIAAEATHSIEPSELELLPDIAESTLEPSPRIQGMPGAFEFNAAQIQSVALTIYVVVTECLVKIAPKLFEATLDVGKEGAKEIIKDRLKKKPAPVESIAPVDAARVHELVRTAALQRRLSPQSAEIIANAVVVGLVLQKQS